MYCGKCGNKLIDGDNFCRNCGFEINTENNDNIYMENNNMKWYNFYTYFSLPLFIIICIYSIIIDLEEIEVITLLSSLVWLVFYGVIFAFLLFKKKIGYYCNFVLLIVTPISFFILSISQLSYEDIFYKIGYILAYMIPSTTWTILNCIYFKKRKELFN